MNGKATMTTIVNESSEDGECEEDELDDEFIKQVCKGKFEKNKFILCI